MQGKLTELLLLCFTLLSWSFSASAGRAQQANGEPSSEAAAAASQPALYRVQYAVREIEKGKPTNTRSYVLMANSGPKGKADRALFRVGSRVPILAGTGGGPNTKVEYENVGMNIDCRLWDTDKGLIVDTSLEMNSVANAEASSIPSTPVFRRLHLEDDTLVVPGKPSLVGSIDDVTADRRYEVEVTATKVK
jgi:hypothetical protein